MHTLYSDFEPGNLLHIALVRSWERGKFNGIILSSELPDGYLFLTANDLDKNKVRIKGLDVAFLAKDKVNYAGEAVALIAGENEKVCRELCRSVKINFTGDVQIPKYEERGICAIAEREIGSSEERETAFAQNENTNEWEVALSFQALGECTGAICQLARDSVIISTQSEDTDVIKESVSSVTSKRIIVNKMHSPMQKNTNAVWLEAYCAALCTLIAVKSDYNTKFVFSREEQERIVDKSLKSVIKTKTSVGENGEIKALEIEIEADVGFVNPMASCMMDYLANANFGFYNVPFFKIKALACNSASTPSGLNMHTMSSEAFFALESHMNVVAKSLNLFPSEIREKNSEQKQIIEAVVKKSDYTRKYVAYKLNSLRRLDPNAKKCLPFSTPLRGIGLSTVSDNDTVAAVVVELELDPCTFRAKIRALHLVIDCGKVDNVSSALMVLKRDIHQVSKRLLSDDSIEISEMSISFVTSDKESSHIGEIVFNAVPAAFTSALGQILSTEIISFPLDTESVFNLYQKNCVIQNRREINDNNSDSQRA